jgi:integrase
MPKKARELTALAVRRLTATGLHAVGGTAGLHLRVSDTGARSWILRVKVGDRRPDVGLGGFPDVTLEAARDKARVVRELVAAGGDPLQAKREAKLERIKAQAARLTFAEAAAKAHRAKAPEFKNPKHAAQWISSLATYAFPLLGELPVDAVEVQHIVSVLEPIWLTKTETATRLRQRIEAVLSWATASNYRSGPNPAQWQGNLSHVLPAARKVAKQGHHAALDWREMGGFMARLGGITTTTARALEFTILTAARSGEVRNATWAEVDLEAATWTIPAERMKADKLHRVPLCPAAVAILKALPRRKDCPLLFASSKCKPLSENAFSVVLKRLDAAVTTHGFRSAFKDWARSSTAFADEVSELALAHVATDKTRAAYARDQLLDQRRAMMAAWAEYCATPREASATVTPIRSARA